VLRLRRVPVAGLPRRGRAVVEIRKPGWDHGQILDEAGALGACRIVAKHVERTLHVAI
jgi:hypothetical protein